MRKTEDFWIGDRIVRPAVGEIQLGIESIHIEPRSMDVLIALARRAPGVALKQDLIDEVWGEKFVSDEVLTHAIWDLRRAFGDQASNPEFIQTIPKRGYRLIAPLRDFEGEDETESAALRTPSHYRRALIGALGIAVLVFALSMWMPTRTPERSFHAPPGPLTLTLVPSGPPDGDGGWASDLDGQLLARLVGTPEVEVREGESCALDAGPGRTYCLEPLLLPRGDGYAVRAQLRDASSLESVYTTPFVVVSERAGLGAAADRLADLARTSLEVVGRWDLKDADIRPWISLQKHDIRAIRDFLTSLDYVYRHEVGGRNPLASAMAIDPNFIAPLVWRTPTIAAEEDAAAQAAHRAALENLYPQANAFEKAMIGWALAHLEGELERQVRQLRVALKLEPQNRPVRLVLGGALLGTNNFEESWQAFASLLDEGWCHPALFPLAVQSAQALDRLKDSRRGAEQALQCQPVDPWSLAVLRLLAIYDGDVEGETRYGEQLEQRLREMLPETVEIDLSDPAEFLAIRAESEGRSKTAERLREFAN